MSGTEVERIKTEIVDRYRRRTKGSEEHTVRAARSMPGGDTRSIAFYRPYPFFAVSGLGCRLEDVDGNEYIDFVNNMTSLIHGHAHPHVMKAVRTQTEAGISHGTPVEAQYRLAELLTERIPSLDTVRFNNTGSEATMFCLRAARAFTGKDGILKMDGGYHGCHDYVQVNTKSDHLAEGLPRIQLNRGVPAGVAGDVFVAPFNDLAAAERILSANRDAIAAIAVEPLLGAGGGIAPQAGYLKGLRELADTYGALLIFDEIISYRLHEGGFQTLADVRPDLTALGKIIGGGLPIGAFGGRADIMALFDPNHPEAVDHSGTFSGNALAMTAGYANLEIYTQAEADRINALGERLSKGLSDAIAREGLPGGTRGIGSIVGIAFTDEPLVSAKDVSLSMGSTAELLRFLHLEMLNRGVFFVHRGLFVVSTPMTETDIDNCVRSFEEALHVVRPLARAIVQ